MRLDLHPHLGIDLHLYLCISPLPHLNIGLLHHLNFYTRQLGIDPIFLSLGLILLTLDHIILSIDIIMRSVLIHHIGSDTILHIYIESEDVETLILMIASSRVSKLRLLLLMVNWIRTNFLTC